MIALHIIAAWFLADAESGIVHFVMDKHLTDDGLLAGVSKDNELHHRVPRSITDFSYLQNIANSWPAATIALVLAGAGAPTFLWLSFAFLTFGNVIHRWAHTPRRECPRVVRFLQRTGVFISQDHHAGHHYAGGQPLTRAESSRRFCVMTNYVNTYLEWRSR